MKKFIFSLLAIIGVLVLVFSPSISEASSLLFALTLPLGADGKLFDFKGSGYAAGLVKELSGDKSNVSLVEYLEEQHYKSLGISSPYIGMSYKEIIAARAKMRSGETDFVPTAVEINMALNGIKVGRDTFSKFSSLNNGAGEYLLPAYLELMFEVELFRDDVYNSIVGQSIGTSSLAYKKLKLVHSDEDVQLGRVAIGAKLPEFKYETGVKSENMQKLGGKWRIPQEHLDAMVISAQDAQIGQIVSYMQVEQTNEALRVIKAGDANGGALTGSSLIKATASSGSVSSTDAIQFLLFGKPQYFRKGFALVGNASSLGKWFAGMASLMNYPGKTNDMKLSQPTAVIQWDEGVFASGGASQYEVIKFSPDAVKEVYQNPGVRIGQMTDEDGNRVYTVSKANVYVKGPDYSAVALNIQS